VNSGSLVVSGTVAGVTNNASFTIQQGGVAGSVSNLLGASGTNNGTVAALANAGVFTNSGNITGNAATSGTLTSNGRISGTLAVNGGEATIGNGGQVSGASSVNSGSLVVSGTVAGVTNNSSLTVQQAGVAGSVSNLFGATGTNSGMVASLANAGTFTNGGNITGNATSSGTLTSTGRIGGTLSVDGEVTTIGSGASVVGATRINAGVLEGVGTVGQVAVNADGAIAPGLADTTGTLTTGNMTWNAGGIYDWQTLSLNGSGIAGTDWDLIKSGGSLIINASANSTVDIRVTSLSGNLTDDIKKAQWEIGNFDGGITGYNKSFFSVNATGLGARGRFFVTTAEDSLMLNYKTAAVWLGGSGNWTTPSEWENDFRPENEDLVEFSGNGGVSTNNYASGDLSEISGIAFTSLATGSYTVNGNALSIGEDGILNDSAFEQTIALNLTGGEVLGVNTATSNLTISGVISGNSALSKTGNKTLTLTGGNTYRGGTTVTAGTLAGTTEGLKGAIVNNAVVNFNQSFNGTYAGAMSGTGSLTKSGSGIVLLSGNNTYSGGATINSGVLAAAVVSGNLVTLNSNAFGTGSVNINSGGAILVPSTTLGGSRLALGGDLTLNNGTIAFYDIGESPKGQDLRVDVNGNFTNAGNGVVFDFSQVQALDSGNYTLVSYNGTNFATGSISSRAGVGTTLQGSFSFNGSSLVYTVLGAESSGKDIQNNGGPNTPIVADYTINQPGVVTIGTNNTVAALTFNSGGTLNIQQNGVLNVSSGTLNVQNGSSVVGGGTLVAPAGLNKDGTGELDFTNNVVVTGTASVNAGLLSVNGQLSANSVVVNPTATLGGAGVIVAPNVVVNGNLSPGNSPGTLNVVGNLILTGANSTIIEIASPTNFDRILVSGQATLGGTLNAVAYGGGSITPGTRYDFLQAGSIAGEFASLIAPEGLRVRFLNSGTVGTLLFGPGTYVPMALNPNEQRVASALNTFIAATDGDQQTVSIALDSLTTEQFPAAFDQIMPGFYESLANIAIEQAFNQTQMLNQRISSVRLGAAGFQAIGGISQPLVHDKNGKSAADAKDASPIVESATATNWNSWALGTGMFSRSTNLGSVDNYNNDAGGFLVGADYRWSENFVTGLYGGYDYSYAEYNGGGSTKGNSFNFGTYASYAKDGYYADAVIGGGYTGFQTQRSIEFSTIDRTASADPGSGQFTAGLNLGKDFEVGKFTLGPIVGAQYTYAGIGSFTESGAESLDLSLGQQNANSLRSTLGGRIAYTWNVNQKIALIPEVRMFWQHEFLNNPRTINASLDGGNGAAFDFETTDPYRDSVFAGAGVTAQFGERWNASLFYNINFGSQTYQSNMVSAGLNFSF
jgi:outer membrane autotransporter protein